MLQLRAIIRVSLKCVDLGYYCTNWLYIFLCPWQPSIGSIALFVTAIIILKEFIHRLSPDIFNVWLNLYVYILFSFSKHWRVHIPSDHTHPYCTEGKCGQEQDSCGNTASDIERLRCYSIDQDSRDIDGHCLAHHSQCCYILSCIPQGSALEERGVVSGK